MGRHWLLAGEADVAQHGPLFLDETLSGESSDHTRCVVGPATPGEGYVSGRCGMLEARYIFFIPRGISTRPLRSHGGQTETWIV